MFFDPDRLDSGFKADMEDLGDGLYSAVLAGPERDALGPDPEDRLPETGEGIYIPCSEERSPLAACAMMALVRAGGDLPEAGPIVAPEALTADELTAILADFDMEAEYWIDPDPTLLPEALADGESVVCFISAQALRHPEMEVLPGMGDRTAVLVTGIDLTDPFGAVVTVDDPAEGQGGTVWPLDRFLRAWSLCGRAALAIGRRSGA